MDPDDVTRAGIIKAGAEDLLFGSSVMPGAMLLLAHIKGIQVIGVPASAIFHGTTVLDSAAAPNFGRRKDLSPRFGSIGPWRAVPTM